MWIQVRVRHVVVEGPALQMNGKWMEFSLSPHNDRQACVTATEKPGVDWNFTELFVRTVAEIKMITESYFLGCLVQGCHSLVLRIHFQWVPFAYGPRVDSIHNVACRTETILANHSCISHVGWVLGDDSLRSAKQTPHNQSEHLRPSGLVARPSSCVHQTVLSHPPPQPLTATLTQRHQTNSQFSAVN